jgi:hypothetical protein
MVKNLASEVKRELPKTTAGSKKVARAHLGEANRPNPENEQVVALTPNLVLDVFSGVRETTLNDQMIGRTSILAVWSDYSERIRSEPYAFHFASFMSVCGMHLHLS